MTRIRTVLSVTVALLAVASAAFGLSVLAPSHAGAATTWVAAAAPTASPSPAPRVAGIPSSGLRGAPIVSATPTPSAAWDSNFFNDIQVTFAGTGLKGPFQLVPYTNQLPTSDLGFWLNISSLNPLSFANVTIWGTEWPTATGVTAAIAGFNPDDPSVQAMQIPSSDPNVASYYFDNYRFFWPGSLVYFNITAVDEHASPSTVKSSTNDSIPIAYPGGYTDLATWAFSVDTPWASGNFSNDIAISTTPNVLSTPSYAPNANQSLGITITAIDLGGTVAPIPDAQLSFTLVQDGVASSYSEAFGPIDHTQMSIARPLGPYPGSTLSFNVTAWLPWEGGAVDTIASPEYQLTWSPNGGWWYPTQGLLANLELASSPDVLTGGALANSPSSVPTDAPVNLTIHEPIQNVTIASAVVDFSFDDNGLVRTGTDAMSPISANTSYAVIAGLPPGSSLTFSILAKDIHGNPISSGNFSYTESGPTNPPLPAGRGLVFLEVLDLSTGALVPNFSYSLSNATWSTTGTARSLGFASPTLPGTWLGQELGFGLYDAAVTVFGVTHSAVISISASGPTPTIVFYAESSPAAIPTTASVGVASLAAALGLAAAAVAAVPLSGWLEERRRHHAEEERRITL